jgi:hypothetical protein
MAGEDSRMPVKIYLASLVVRGQTVTQHKRLSDYLNSRVDDGTISARLNVLRQLILHQYSQTTIGF